MASNNDFGMGLIGTSSGNLIEQNSIGGNTNGILIHLTASGNTIRQNTVTGNPPGQVSRTYGPIGFDSRMNRSNGARNTFERNRCISYSGPGPSPCPNFPAVMPPAILVEGDPERLWPPSGKMVPVTSV